MKIFIFIIEAGLLVLFMVSALNEKWGVAAALIGTVIWIRLSFIHEEVSKKHRP